MAKDKEKKKEYDKVYSFKNREKRRATSKKHYDKNIEKYRELHREYAKEHKKEAEERSKKYYSENIDKIKRKRYYNKELLADKQLLIKFNLTRKEYNEKLELQNNCCAICGENKSNFKRSLSVDHDHETGKIRGLLCNNCNLLLGHARDSISILEKSIEYLNTHGDKS